MSVRLAFPSLLMAKSSTDGVQGVELGERGGHEMATSRARGEQHQKEKEQEEGQNAKGNGQQ